MAWPFAARAQQPAMPVIGYLCSSSPDAWAIYVTAFHQGLSETGYIEGRDVRIEYRWAEGHYERLPTLAADLIHRQVAVVAANTTAAPVAMAATTTIPIVFMTSADPVATGLVASLSRPGGNLTGVTTLFVEFGPKRLELIRELVPTATTIGLLVNPTSPVAEAKRETCKRQPAPWGCSSMFCAPATNATSTQPLQPLCNREPTRSWSPTIRTGLAAAIKLSRRPHAMRCPRSIF